MKSFPSFRKHYLSMRRSFNLIKIFVCVADDLQNKTFCKQALKYYLTLSSLLLQNNYQLLCCVISDGWHCGGDDGNDIQF